MFSFLHRLSVRNRIWTIVAVLIGSIVVGSVIDILMLRQALWHERELKTRQLVESGFGILTHMHARQIGGELSEAAAQAVAIGAIRAMRYDETEYFWLNDVGRPFPKMIMHPTVPSLDGQFLDGEQFNRATGVRVGTEGAFTPTDGKRNLFVAFTEVLDQGGAGYVTYTWPKPRVGGGVTAEYYPKLSYVKKFEPWGWVIGTGIYIDDVESAVRKQAGRNAEMVAAVSILLLLFASVMARSITQPLQRTIATMRAIGKGDAGLAPRLPVDGGSEIAELAVGFNEMLERLELRDAELARHRESLEDEVVRRALELRDSNLKLEQELTERQLTQQALHESDERFRSICATAQDAIILLDNRCNIGYWNPAAEKIFGHSADEALGRDLHELLAPERFRAAFRHGFEKFRLTGEGGAVGKTVELAGLRKDGSEFPMELSISAVHVQGSWVAVGFVRDISERKRAELAMRENNERLAAEQKKSEALLDRMEEAQSQLLQSEKLASLGQLAAGVAHEINNPIGFVRSNLGALDGYVKDLFALIAAYEQLETVPEQPDGLLARIRELKAEIDLPFIRGDLPSLISESNQGIDRVAKIIQNLKDFSHVDRDEKWAQEDLHKGLDSTINVVWNELKYKCELRKEYGDLPLVECLLFQLNQVFLNLLVNAAHAIETEGIITLRSGVQGDQVWLEVSDTGKGIAPANLTRIFDPFFTTKPVGKGTGLGLSVSYSIIKKHHGRIEVESQVGVGTTFRIWLPVRQPDESADTGSPEQV